MPDALPHQGSGQVEVCQVCSALKLEGYPGVDGGCRTHEWIWVPLAQPLSVDSAVVMPHPDGGWPEVWVTTKHMIHSDDREVVEAERRRLVEEESDRIV